MSFLSVVPDIVAAASGNLQNLGSALRSANATAAAQTTAIAAPAADEVSAAITTLFGTHAQEFQTLNAQAAAFHDNFVNLLNGGAAQYVSTEVANAEQTLANAINTPAQALLGHPLIGTGATGAAAANPADTTSSTIGIQTPFGPISLTTIETTPSLEMNGPVSLISSATTPLGNAAFSLYGNLSYSASPLGNTWQFTGGALNVPFGIPLLLAAAGPYVTGEMSLANSTNAFFTAVSSGNILGAVTAFVSTPFDFTGAVLFGHDTITVPVGQLGSGGPNINWQIPFSGIFASPQPLSVSWPDGTYIDTSTGVPLTENVVGADIALQGTQFGGIVPELVDAIVGLL